jgi:hypothetical protein
MSTDKDTIDKEVDENINRILKNLLNEDPLGAVIRGHLYVESKLIQLIEEALPDPGAIDLARLQFPIKLDLAVALELLSDSDKRAYAALNAVRNTMAHNADAGLLAADESRIYRALRPKERARADEGV